MSKKDLILFFLVFAIFAADILTTDFVHRNPLPAMPVVEPHDALAVSAIEEMLMPHLPVRWLIADEDHVFLLTGDVGDHLRTGSRLVNMPKSGNEKSKQKPPCFHREACFRTGARGRTRTGMGD